MQCYPLLNSLLLQNCSLYSFYPPSSLPPCTYMCMNTCMYTNACRSLNWTFNWKKNLLHWDCMNILLVDFYYFNWFLQPVQRNVSFLIDLKRLTAWNLWNGLATFAENEFCFLFWCKMKDACEFWWPMKDVWILCPIWMQNESCVCIFVCTVLCLILRGSERCVRIFVCEFCSICWWKKKAVCALFF